jgi:hypothetical protein
MKLKKENGWGKLLQDVENLAESLRTGGSSQKGGCEIPSQVRAGSIERQ